MAQVYRYKLVDPDLPSPSDYLELLEEIHRNKWYSNFGPLARRLEDKLLMAFGHPGECCVTCANATSGLSAALIATGRTGPVVVPAFTFPASLGAVRAANMVPIVVDVDPQSWSLDAISLSRALAENVANIVMLVTPFGIGRNWEQELALCRKHGAAVVIDSASGLGGPRPADAVGAGAIEVYSMHVTKPLGIGEGGAIFADRGLEAALRSALNFGLATYEKPQGPAWGLNGKMSEFHAAVGIAQTRRITDILRRRRAFAAIYRDRIEGRTELSFPHDLDAAPWQFFPILLPSGAAAETFIETAALAGIEIRRYYRPSLSQWPHTTRLEPCPVAEDLADRMCVLPVRALDDESRAAELAELVLDLLDRSLTQH